MTDESYKREQDIEGQESCPPAGLQQARLVALESIYSCGAAAGPRYQPLRAALITHMAV